MVVALYGFAPLVLGVRPKVDTGCAPAVFARFEARRDGRDLAERRDGIEKTERSGRRAVRGDGREADVGVRTESGAKWDEAGEAKGSGESRDEGEADGVLSSRIGT